MPPEKLTYEKTDNPNIVIINGVRYQAMLEIKPGMFLQCISGQDSSFAYTNDIVIVTDTEVVGIHSDSQERGVTEDLKGFKEEQEHWKEITYEEVVKVLSEK